MDTKLRSNNTKTNEHKINPKNNKKKYITNFVAIISILIIAMIMVGLYPKIDAAAIENDSRHSKSQIYLYVINEAFSEDLSKNTFVLYKEALETMQNSAVNASDIYLKPESEFDNSNDYNVFKDKINDSLKDWKKDLEDDSLNLDYAVLDKDKNVLQSNNENNLSTLINSKDANALKDKYSFYVSIKFDENGELNVNDVYIENGDLDVNNKKTIRDNLLYYKLRKIIYTDNNDVFNPIKNMTFIYGINKDLKYYDKFKINLTNMTDYRYNNVVNMYMLIFSLICIILSIFIPFKLENEIILFKKLFKVPFEAIVILLSITICFMFSEGPDLIRDAVYGSFATVILSETLKFESAIGDKVVYLFNIFYWFVFFTLISFSTIAVKNIFNIGLIKYCKERTLTGIFIRFVKRISKRTYEKAGHMVSDIDLRDKSNKIIIKILVLNYLIILVMCFLWILGIGIFPRSIKFIWTILIMIFYFAICFRIIKKYYSSIRNKFNILLNSTNRIADGNLDAKIDEDVGLFNPIKEQIEKIQIGFKKAVGEEVKSQKMKTELISNVSHDLKTPLTSIITYVDLLKNENISEEDRKAYIDTLDRKSQRLKFLIEDLFEVSKATSGNITLNLVKVDIVELMRQTQIELEDKINRASLKIKNNFPESKVILELDSQKTFRIFENLLNNVIKYAMEGSRVYVDIIEDEESIEITMKNMSAEEISFNAFDIVERFQRGDKSRNTEGSGLGLAIVKSFVEAQRGTFNIEIDGDLFKAIIKFNK